MTIGTVFESLRNIPDLPGARCRGRWDLWESYEPNDRRVAVTECKSCPALDACRAWVRSLPSGHRPRGTVAGRLGNPSGQRDYE